MIEIKDRILCDPDNGRRYHFIRQFSGMVSAQSILKGIERIELGDGSISLGDQIKFSWGSRVAVYEVSKMFPLDMRQIGVPVSNHLGVTQEEQVLRWAKEHDHTVIQFIELGIDRGWEMYRGDEVDMMVRGRLAEQPNGRWTAVALELRPE